MLKRLVCLTCVGAIWLSGCAGFNPSRSHPDESLEGIRQADVQGLNQHSEIVYLLLSAELAGQRGQYEIALNNYLEAAKLTEDAQVAERATQIGLYLKDTEKALTAATLWSERDPENLSARRIAAFLLLKAGHTDKALDQLRALLALPDVDLESALIELVKWLDAEVPKEEGAKVMQRLVTEFPGMAELHFAFALLASTRGEYQLALQEAEKALALHPDWNRARLLQAQVMSQMGDSEAARATVQKALRSDPNNVRLRLIYSQFLAKAGDLRGAERELARILEKDPDNHDARFGLANLLMEAGRDENAKKQFLELTTVSKWRGQAYFYLGLIEARQNRLQNALTWFDRVRSGPLEFDAKVNSITALINLGRITEARQRLVEVRKQFPDEALRLYLLEAELLSKSKDYEAAFDLLTAALEEMPDQMELLYSRALIAEQLDRVDVLETDLRAVLEKNPEDANALNALGYTLADRGARLDEAKQYLDRAIELKPDDPAILDSYGWLQYRLGNHGTALDYLQRAYESVSDPEIAAHLGEVLWESGRHQEAKKVWKEALKKDPGHDDMKKIKIKYREAFE
ncbi:tetratricopeptide tPR_2 repeat-containing protein [Methylocaldum marinum]|uniref:Tetratricopeptide tPR_2 repeat-containing protein n=1 Tax=Methylocaldum marinum TaxID=1432792 RepID=A0A250KUB1_9GAMM|nr:tetratricopeptide tPR_2 repeat-containing protein [Methylocaldum marinum]